MEAEFIRGNDRWQPSIIVRRQNDDESDFLTEFYEEKKGYKRFIGAGFVFDRVESVRFTFTKRQSLLKEIWRTIKLHYQK